MAAFASWLFRQPYLLLTLTAMVWGGNAVAGRLARGEVSPMVLTSLRWVLACTVLVVIARREVADSWPALLPRWRYLLGMGALGFTVFNALFYAAAHHTTAVNLTILQGAIPALVLIGGLLVFGIPVRIVQIAGMATTLVGVGAIASQGSLATLARFELNLGDVWMLLAGVCYAGYTLGLRNRPAVPGLALFSAFAAVAFATSLPLLVYEVVTGTVQWPTPTGWAILAYVALLPSVMGQIMFMRSVELIGPGRAGIFTNLVPIFGALLGVLVLGEPFHAYHLAGLVLVLAGIALAERKPRD